MEIESGTAESAPKQAKRRIVGRRIANERAATKAAINGEAIEEGLELTVQRPSRTRTLNQVPVEILNDAAINDAVALLPSNYNFEIHKTIHRIRTNKARNIALQFPEGLLIFAPTISDILCNFCPGAETIIMGDVTYGACCIDDYTARALGCDLLVHYGHSCLVPLDTTKGIKTLYVFVTIGIDVEHLLATIERNFQPGKRIALVGTIQFNATLHAILPRLRALGYDIFLPRSNPLSAGEILGCTAPTLTSSSTSTSTQRGPAPTGSSSNNNIADMILYLGDGRFHLESILISSPTLRAHTYRYDPYSRRLTHETYEHEEMHSLRRHAIHTARQTLQPPRPRQDSSSPPAPRVWGLILGTLGRQGNPHTLSLITTHLANRGIQTVTLLLSEIMPAKLARMSASVGVWVQVACPRLSIDWGYAFERPLLSPYEALVALEVKEGQAWKGLDEMPAKESLNMRDMTAVEGESHKLKGDEIIVGVYPMDYYEKEGLGRVKEDDVLSLVALDIEVK